MVFKRRKSTHYKRLSIKKKQKKKIIWFFEHFDVTLHSKQDNSYEKVISFIINCYHIHIFLLLRKENRGKEDCH